MKQQVWAIHGGDAFPTYEEYLENLKNCKVDIERIRGFADWKARLGQLLGEEYDVFMPSMPNSRNAKYLEWKIWFEKCIPFMQEEVVLIGHSMGGIFLAKYLSEEDFPKKLRATFLVAAPYDTDSERSIVEFTLPASLEKLPRQSGNIFLYHSKDDPIVEFGELEKYERVLPNATVRIFEDRQHFNQANFPEIVEDIKNLK